MTGSPQLFFMVVNVIIKKIVETGLGFRNEKIYMPALLYADDGMLISTTTTSVWEMLRSWMIIDRGDGD